MIEARDVKGVICPYCGDDHLARYDHPQFLEGDEFTPDDHCGVFFYCHEYRQWIVAIFTLYRFVEGKYRQEFIGMRYRRSMGHVWKINPFASFDI